MAVPAWSSCAAGGGDEAAPSALLLAPRHEAEEHEVLAAARRAPGTHAREQVRAGRQGRRGDGDAVERARGDALLPTPGHEAEEQEVLGAARGDALLLAARHEAEEHGVLGTARGAPGTHDRGQVRDGEDLRAHAVEPARDGEARSRRGEREERERADGDVDHRGRRGGGEEHAGAGGHEDRGGGPWLGVEVGASWGGEREVVTGGNGRRLLIYAGVRRGAGGREG